MSKSIEGISNWMHMFRWIVKLIRDDYGIDEALLTRNATLETDIGLTIDKVEELLDIIAESFGIRFPEGTLDELVKLEELCLLASWMKGYYKRPEFISDGFEARCRAINTIA
ncbi:acyl carrier protein [Azospirillum cavernae]|uniref:Acyl carrier protein n=1 Tax=Azospirillum cavernae TaxID=2320860 RepID=A0A418VVP0_9PROT|nr:MULTISPECIES: acyl carrier protein [Azospirillum]RJF81228.1 acyl carrier protein [Azospirillum cavernae]